MEEAPAELGPTTTESPVRPRSRSRHRSPTPEPTRYQDVNRLCWTWRPKFGLNVAVEGDGATDFMVDHSTSRDDGSGTVNIELPKPGATIGPHDDMCLFQFEGSSSVRSLSAASPPPHVTEVDVKLTANVHIRGHADRGRHTSIGGRIVTKGQGKGHRSEDPGQPR